MPRLLNRNPKYRKHRASGQAVVSIDGQDFYLGPYGTAASRREYDRIVAEWLAGGRRLQPAAEQVTVAELVAAYRRHAKNYYRNPDGSSGRELERIDLSIPLLLKFYGRTEVAAFSPIMVKAIRGRMIESKLARITVNQRVNCIRRIFRWGVSEGMVSPTVLQGLEAVDGLRRGRSEARESEPVRPVAEEIVLATIDHASPQIRAMVKLQLLTGMRPGEVCRMRTCDIDTAGRLWTYRPAEHKTAWHGHSRTVYLGPKAQDVLRDLLKLDTQAFIFTPAESDAWRRRQLHVKRKTPAKHGNGIGTNRKRRPSKRPGECYDAASYRQAIDYACDAAFPPPEHLRPRVWTEGEGDKARERHETKRAFLERLTPEQRKELADWRRQHRWHPHQLRHTAATRLRKEFGLEAAQVILGHKSLAITEIYAEKNVQAAQRIMSAVG